MEAFGEGFVIAQPGSPKLKHCLGVLVVVPEFLAPLDSLVELLDPGLDGTAGDRQPRAAVSGVVHPLLIVGQVGMFTAEQAPWVLRFVVGVELVG